ncbi:DUF397 domain-containing protein [Streptomyces sp. TR06-5]|uniref:DUF397 domain-containing protein n=1 Tax=unclassified Streptomyces TaxID=2593676 RepID=UPI0039A2411E
MSDLVWRKSTYSDSSGGECLEMAPTRSAVHVRDSKDTAGPVLRVPRAAWRCFVARLREDASGPPAS